LSDAVRERVRLAVEAALDKKAFELEVLDVTGLTAIADFFILCSASSERQTGAIYDAIEERVREEGRQKPLLVEGVNPGRWILMDYGDFIIHIFTDDTRRFYSLERLWGDAPNVTSQFAPATAAKARG
jgi:ribosome-associated protein